MIANHLIMTKTPAGALHIDVLVRALLLLLRKALASRSALPIGVIVLAPS